jgi:acetyl esterase/lipase
MHAMLAGRLSRGLALSAAVAGALMFGGCLTARASLRDRLAERRAGGAAAPAVQHPGRAGNAEVKRDLVYGQGSGADLKLDLYLPQGPGPHPIAIYIHGGGWTEGSKAMGKGLCTALAQRGYLAASIDYRLADVAPWPAQIDDCMAATRWLQAHAGDYGGAPGQVVVTGGSAGGQLALSLACGWSEGGKVVNGAPQEYPWPGRPIKACCSWYGPTDMALLGQVPKLSLNLQEYLGETQAQRAVSAPSASPLLYVDPHDPPVLFIHGTKDPLVPIEQSRTMHAALQAAGVKTDIIEVPGGSHGIFLAKPEELAKLAQRMIDWFDQQLGRQSSAPAGS